MAFTNESRLFSIYAKKKIEIHTELINTITDNIILHGT